MLVVTSSGQHFQITCRHMYLMQLRLSQEMVTVFTSSWSVTSFSFQDSLVFVVVGLFNHICCYFLVKASFFLYILFFSKKINAAMPNRFKPQWCLYPQKTTLFYYPICENGYGLEKEKKLQSGLSFVVFLFLCPIMILSPSPQPTLAWSSVLSMVRHALKQFTKPTPQ